MWLKIMKPGMQPGMLQLLHLKLHLQAQILKLMKRMGQPLWIPLVGATCLTCLDIVPYVSFTMFYSHLDFKSFPAEVLHLALMTANGQVTLHLSGLMFFPRMVIPHGIMASCSGPMMLFLAQHAQPIPTQAC